MKNIFNILVINVLLVFISVNGYAQIADNDIRFPDDWLGTYNGKMYVVKSFPSFTTQKGRLIKEK